MAASSKMSENCENTPSTVPVRLLGATTCRMDWSGVRVIYNMKSNRLI